MTDDELKKAEDVLNGNWHDFDEPTEQGLLLLAEVRRLQEENQELQDRLDDMRERGMHD